MFVEEYLQDLRRERFSPRALIEYARKTGAYARRQIDANPSAVRSIWSLALGFFAVDFLAAAGIALAGDRHLAVECFVDTALVIAPTFGLVTLHLGLLRNQEGFRLSAVNLPIMLTLLRIVLLPALVLFLLDQRFLPALGLFAVAALSDIADGAIARRTGQITQLGTILDPLVDIVFNLTLFVGLALSSMLPPWVAWVAVGRYALLLVGGAWLYLFVGPVKIQPTTFGRMTGVVMAALVGLLTLLHALPGTNTEALAPLTRVALGALLIATVVQVCLLGWHNLRLMRGQAAEARRVVSDVRWGAR